MRNEISMVMDGAVISGCDAIGLMGGCGFECDYFADMDCPESASILDGITSDQGYVLYPFQEVEIC